MQVPGKTVRQSGSAKHNLTVIYESAELLPLISLRCIKAMTRQWRNLFFFGLCQSDMFILIRFQPCSAMAVRKIWSSHVYIRLP